MKIFLLDLWHDLKEKRLWPVAVVLLAALVAVPVLLAKPSTAPSAPAPAATAAGPEGRRAEAAREGQARRGRAGRRLDPGRVRPGQPVQAAEGRDQEAGGRHLHGRRSEHRRQLRHFRVAPTPAAPTRAGAPAAAPGRHARWHAPEHRRRDHHHDHGLQVRGRPDLHRQRPHAAHQGHGEARHAAERELAAPDLHGRHAQGLGRRVPGGLDARGSRRGPLQAERSPSARSRYIGAGSEHIFSEENGDTYTVRIDEIRKVKIGSGANSAGANGSKADGAKARASVGPNRRFVPPLFADLVVVATDTTVDFRHRYGKSIGRGHATHHPSPALTLIAAALLVVPAAAGGAEAPKAPTPTITRVQPMRVAVGGTLTITGRNFKARVARTP